MEKEQLIFELKTLVDQEKFSQAFTYACKIAEQFPNEPAGFYTAGLTLALKGNLDLALKYLFHTITINPLYLSAHIWVGRIISETEDSSKRRIIFDKWENTLPANTNLESVITTIFCHFRSTSEDQYWNVISCFSRMYMDLKFTEKALQSFYFSIIDVTTFKKKLMSASDIECEYSEYDYDIEPMHIKTVNDFSEFVCPILIGKSNFIILDAACGSGLAAKYLRLYAKTLIGIDISKTMTARAQKTQLYDEVTTGDIKKKNTAYENLDVIHCLGATYYFPDLEPFFFACYSMMKPGGLLFFTDYPAPPNIRAGVTIGSTARYCRSDTFTIAIAKKSGFQLNLSSYGMVYGIPSRYWSFHRL